MSGGGRIYLMLQDAARVAIIAEVSGLPDGLETRTKIIAALEGPTGINVETLRKMVKAWGLDLMRIYRASH